MRRQSFCPSPSNGSGEPLIVVEESVLDEAEEEGSTESPSRGGDPDSPSLNPYLLSPWREARKHSLPTPQCTSGITASQVRRLSERGEGSGASAREAAFLSTLTQVPTPQTSGRRHSVVTISRVPSTFFGRRRESSAFPMGCASKILQNRRESSGAIICPTSQNGSSHSLQLDIMDDIAEIKARKVRLKMYKTQSRERVCEIQPLEGNTSSMQKYTQQQRRFSEFSASIATSTKTLRRRASEMTRTLCDDVVPGTSAAGIICSNNDLISIMSSLTSSASEINTCDADTCDASCSGDEQRFNQVFTTIEQKRSRMKSSRSNSFDVSILHSARSKMPNDNGKTNSIVSLMTPSTWFAKRHQPMAKKNQYLRDDSARSLKLDKSKMMKVVKETLGKTSTTKDGDTKHKVVWDGISGTKVDAQVFGNAIEKILTAQKGSEAEASGSSSAKSAAVSPNKLRATKVTGWFSGGNKEQEQPDYEPSICSSLKDLFVK